MALSLFTSPPFSSLSFSPFSASSSASATASTNPLIRLCNVPIVLQPKLYVGCRVVTPLVKSRGTLVVKAAADVDGAGSTAPESPATPADTKEESVPVEKLPLESKLQQKMQMKIAKKIRLRRKRLVRKRHLRKKGRWPPSKLKKNKNI